MNVLIVDQSKILRSFVASSTNCRVYEASNGQEAMDRLDEQLIDVCIINPNLPSNSGIELLYEVSSHADLTTTKYVLLADNPSQFQKFESELKELGVVEIIRRSDLSKKTLEQLVARVQLK